MAVALANRDAKLMTLKQAREKLTRLSQIRLSRMAGLGRSTVTNIELGNAGSPVCYDTAYKICKVLGVEIHDIRWPNGLTSYNSGRVGSKKVAVPVDYAFDRRAQTCPTCFIELRNNQCDYC